MNSCAHWLLWKEYIEFQKAGLEGIQARPANDNFLEWEVQLEGLKNTLWEGAVLELTLLFSDAYNSVPPTVTFVTIPFHPNVDLDSGRLCLSWLDNRQDWQAGFSISSILLSIQVLLSNPVLEGAVNLTAANMLGSSPSSYHKVLLECVQASQELDRIRKDEHPNSQNKRPVKIIHFEEYLEAWTKMATSTTGSWLRNKAPEDLIKSAETKCPEREAFKALMYGTLHEPKKTERVSEWRQARVDQLRRIYMLHRSPDLLTLRTPVQRDCLGPRNDSQIGGKQDGWENEVDKLVAWTHSLSFQALEGE